MKTVSPQTMLSTKRTAGFSLVEVLVSLTLFTIVVTISVGTLLVLIDANAKAQSMQVVMNNLSFALDSMTREIRTGDSYFCDSDSSDLPISDVTSDQTQDCPGGATALSFKEGGESLTEGLGSDRIAYRLESGGGAIERRLANTSDWVPVTSPDVVIDELEFVVTGSTRGDEITPTISIYLNGTVVAGDGIGSNFDIQTTVTQQLLDI